MDYKYIQQLLDRYWECQSTLEEEAILRSFFAQDDLPASLLPYRDLFLAEEEMKQEGQLSDNFDEKVLRLIEAEQTTTKARRMSISVRFRPLFKACGMIAVVVALGMAAQHGWEDEEVNVGTSTVAVQPGDSTEMPEVSGQATAVQTTIPADSLEFED